MRPRAAMEDREQTITAGSCIVHPIVETREGGPFTPVVYPTPFSSSFIPSAVRSRGVYVWGLKRERGRERGRKGERQREKRLRKEGKRRRASLPPTPFAFMYRPLRTLSLYFLFVPRRNGGGGGGKGTHSPPYLESAKRPRGEEKRKRTL